MSTDERDGPAPENRWLAETGGRRGASYAARFRQLQARGEAVHGEAEAVQRLLDGIGRSLGSVLDAGCGTGRIAQELARRGHEVAGVDLDASMLAEARKEAPGLAWVEADLADLTPDVLAAHGLPTAYDVVLAAGNVMVYLTPGTEEQVVARLAALTRPGGLLVAGFAHDRHVSRDAYDGWCRAAGLAPVTRWSTWEGDPDDGGGYAVHVHGFGTAADPD